MTYEGNRVANTPPAMLVGASSAYVVNSSLCVALFMRGNTEQQVAENAAAAVVGKNV